MCLIKYINLKKIDKYLKIKYFTIVSKDEYD